MRGIVILTGAGISAESGLATFRASDGLWCGHRVEDVATPEGFEADPALVHQFYNERRRQLREVQPNAAHYALARFAHEWNVPTLLVTQNVDDLHDRTLTRTTNPHFSLLHMHGELLRARCNACQQTHDWHQDMTEEHGCDSCGVVGQMRPHIVWFGEMPLGMKIIDRALASCELFASIGTSGNVYPAAGFVQQARMAGAHTVELNLEPSLGHSLFAQTRYGPATHLVPEFVEELLNK